MVWGGKWPGMVPGRPLSPRDRADKGRGQVLRGTPKRASWGRSPEVEATRVADGVLASVDQASGGGDRRSSRGRNAASRADRRCGCRCGSGCGAWPLPSSQNDVNLLVGRGRRRRVARVVPEGPSGGPVHRVLGPVLGAV